MKSKSKVYLVGAGPGDAGLLTLRGAELLQRADVVVFDRLVNPSLLQLARPEAEIISRGKRTDIPQEEVTELLITKAREGKTVVRLKGGDPYIFGRGAEEAEALVAAKIPFEVIPGVSSISAAPNYAGIPLTHRAFCSSFTVFTGHEHPEKGDTHIRYEQIAKIPGTKVVLMGVDHLCEWSDSLIKHGVPKETPVAMIQWGTRGRQRSISGTLETIPQLAMDHKMSPPVLTVIGEVVKLREKLNWAEQRPLSGKKIVVTRRTGQAGKLSSQLAELGADVLEIPTIRITETTERELLIDVLLELNSYEWFVFTSANGVRAFFELFFRRFKDLRDIGGARIAAVGPATAQALRDLHLQVDLEPEAANARKLAEAFKKYQDIDNVKICLLRAEVANRDLPMALEEMGAIVDDVPVYKTVPETEDRTGDTERLLEAGADWVTFTSASTVEHFHARLDLPKLTKQFPKLKIASIGPETTKAIKALKLEPALEAREHTTEGLVTALLKAA